MKPIRLLMESLMSRSFAWAASSALLACALHSSALAADGPAPSSQERRVVSGVHADAISVFFENGGLVLGTKADVDGGLGVRLNPAQTAYNVEESTRTTVPAGASYAFLGGVGSDVWLAPESNPNGTSLWPGFSTEGVANGAVDGNQLTLRLESVTGPGTLQIYQTSAFGEPVRRLSSTGTEFRAWTVANGTHAHANWAFSAAGAYTLTFSASALTNGVSISSTQSYAFVVGNVPATAATTTTLTASTNRIVQGDAVTLDATVTPNTAVGWVEFLDGATVLGHDAVNTGTASLSTTNLLLGTRSVTARFVPQWLNDFSASTSAPVAITNTEPGGVLFSIAGVAAAYQPGDTLTATAVGLTLQAGQKYRWQWRVSGAAEFEVGDVTIDPVFSRDLSASDDGYEVSVSVWACEEWDEYCNDGTQIAQTAWVPVTVVGLGVPIVAQLTSSSDAFMGDEATIAVSGRVLGEGETLQVVRRAPAEGWHVWSSDELFVHQDGTVRIYLLTGGEFAVRVLNAEGLALTQSKPMPITVDPYEIQIAGVQGLYRPGATLQAQGIIHPESPDLHYRWSFFVPGGMPDQILKEGYGSDALTLEIPDLTLAHNSGVLFLVVSAPVGPPYVEEAGLTQVGELNVRVYVRDIDPGVQIFQFQPLSDHYHQGNAINLVLAADPPPAQGDQIVWEWKWPGTDWTNYPGGSGLSRTVAAEQALDGLQVRATLAFASTNTTVAAGPVTIFVDDHGAAARQQPTIVGATSHTAGDTVTLTRHLPANGPTILTTHRWERKAAGATEFSPVAGASGATLSFTATTADDGAQYRVSILKPDGTVAYGPSPAVTLDVEPPAPVEFAIAGIAPSYLPGQTMNATVVGTNLQSGQNFRWQMRPIGSTGTGANVVSSSTSDTYARVLSAADNGYEIRVLLRSGSTILAQTAWVPITVGNLVEPLSLTWTAGSPAYMGDPLTASIGGRALVEGETLRVVRRTTGTWSVPDRTTISNNIVTTEPLSGPFTGEWALQVVSNSVAVAQSAPIPVQWLQREIVISGVQSVYRVGQSIQATATIYPPRDGIEFYWTLIDLTTFQSEDFYGGTDPLALTFERVVGLTNHNNQFSLVAFWTYPDGAGANIGQGNATINVTTADPSTQLFFFNSLGAHYHQGDLIGLKLIADPGLAQGDTITWEWKWPGEDWTTFPGASGLSNAIVAEQALEGVQVRATLAFGHTNTTMVAEPVTIFVDDHGAAPRQQPTIVGATSHTAGDTVTLTRQLPANGPTILTAHRWERKAAGASEFTVVPNATAAQLTFTATMLDDGAEYRVSILKPDGTVAYGPSPAVTLAVRPKDLALTITNGEATLTLNTEVGRGYQLLSAPTVAGPWEELGAPIPGTGQTVPVVVPVSGPAGFYQWRVVESP